MIEQKGMPRAHYDAVVVGARCAGAATAMLLARRGLRVLAVERSRYGTDTLSTHALMRAGVLQLHRWGLLPALRATDTPPVRKASFHYGDEVVAIEIKPRGGLDALYAPRRTVLDPLLADGAMAAGADLAYGVRLVGLLRREDGRVSGVILQEGTGEPYQIGADIVIGADGLRSTVAGLTGAEVSHAGRHASSVVYGYWSGLDADGYQWHFRPGVSAGAIPTGGGTVCLFAAMPPRRFHEEIRLDLEAGYRKVIAEAAPDLASALDAARLVGPLRGFAGERGFIRRAWGAGWALVGDAGYFRDPITAHGITDALRDAEFLARAVAAGAESALAEYQAIRDDFAVGMFEATDVVASFEWDLETVKEQHVFMSEEMKREAVALAELDHEETPAPVPEAVALRVGGEVWR